MTAGIIAGDWDPRFNKVVDVFRDSLTSRFEVGASFAVEIEGEMLINLWVVIKMPNALSRGSTTRLLTSFL